MGGEAGTAHTPSHGVTLRDPSPRLRRIALVAIAMVGVAGVFGLASCGNQPATEETTGGETMTALPSLVTGPDDSRLLSQGQLPAIANVDYSRFPTGGDPSLPQGTSYYVSADGDDSAPGTEEQPFRTIEQALLAAGDGDRVMMRGGTYESAGLVVTQSNLLLAGYEDEAVIVEAADGSVGLSIATPGQHDVLVRGLALLGFEDVGIYVGSPDTVRTVVLEDIHVRGSTEGLSGAYEEGLLVEGLLVQRLVLEDIGDIGFQFGTGEARDVRIVGLHVQMSGGGGDNSGSDALAFEHGNNVLIENSIVEGAGADGIDLKASQVAVVNSIVRHLGRNGIKLWNGGDVINTLVFDTGADAQVVTEVGTYRVINSTFAYHLMRGGESYAATFGYGEPGATDITLVNNVFYSMPSRIYFAPGAQVHLEHNVFYGFPDSIIEFGDQEYGPSDIASVFGASNLYTDPGFADPGSFDFHPTQGSPLLGAGSTAAGTPPFDVLGMPRTGTYTVGAFQQ